MNTKKKELVHTYAGEKRGEVVAAFEIDRKQLHEKGYVVVEEMWSEPGPDERDGRIETARLNHSPGVVATHLGVGETLIGAGRERLSYRLEVRYAPVEAAAKSQGGLLDIVVTNNGRCPTCDRPTMQMPRPPFERYCNECETEFPA